MGKRKRYSVEQIIRKLREGEVVCLDVGVDARGDDAAAPSPGASDGASE